MLRLFRLLKIFWIAYRFGLYEFPLAADRTGRLPRLVRRILFWRRFEQPRAVRLRRALEELGPIFVKFGQVLSTRRDLLPTDIADELAKLQDQVPPFSSDLAVREVEAAFGRPLERVFARFDRTPVASASIAQVHFAELPDGTEAAVKILRPNMDAVIAHDLALMQTGAGMIDSLWAEGRRLKPREVVAEFAKYLRDELDLMREAANASQLRRNFLASDLLLVPEIYWDYCAANVITMERMHGIPISQRERLEAAGIDIPALARAGVEIFFSQVFRDGFFHADMHPGNIFVAADGKYIALDFGIMGTLDDRDKDYLAQNFLAFFRRDYKRVAIAHVEAGWVPAETRIDEFEGAIRAVCEPIFDRPLREISFGRVLVRLFQTARRFNLEVQPQLVLLQKTLLNIEGLGRQLDPDLDLWTTAKPYLERWMSEQVGWHALVRKIRSEAPRWTTMIPQLPRLLHRSLEKEIFEAEAPLRELEARIQKLSRRVMLLTLAAAALAATIIALYLRTS